MLQRQEFSQDKLITDGKGGPKLEQFSQDIGAGYKFSAIEKELKKPVSGGKKVNDKPKVLLRQVSEMEQYR